MTKRWLIPTALAVLAVAGVATWLLLNRSVTVNGDVTITDLGGVRSVGATCQTTGGYADIREGAQVTITDSAGKVVGVATLGPGSNGNAGGGRCSFPFSAEVAGGSDFYGFSLGPRRGVLQVPAAEINSVHLTLG